MILGPKEGSYFVDNSKLVITSFTLLLDLTPFSSIPSILLSSFLKPPYTFYSVVPVPVIPKDRR